MIANSDIASAMQISLDPASGELIGATAAEQIAQCLRNIVAIVAAAGGAHHLGGAMAANSTLPVIALPSRASVA